MYRWYTERQGGALLLHRAPNPGSRNEPIARFGTLWHAEAELICHLLNEMEAKPEEAKRIREELALGV